MKKERSCGLLGSDVHGAEVEKVGIRVVAIDLQDFGNESAAGPAFDVDDDVKGVGDVRLDRTVRKLDTTLKYAAGKTGQSLFCGTCMDRTQRAGVASIEELQEIERLTSSNFTEQNAIGPVPQ